MGISITGNNEIGLLTLMFTIKRKNSKTNKQSKMEHKYAFIVRGSLHV